MGVGRGAVMGSYPLHWVPGTIRIHERNQGYGRTKLFSRTDDLAGAPFCQWSAEASRVCGYIHDDRRVFSTHRYTHMAGSKVYHESLIVGTSTLYIPYTHEYMS